MFEKAAEVISQIVFMKIALNWMIANPGFFLIVLAVVVWVYMAWRHRKDSSEFTFSLRSVNQIVTIIITLGLFFGGFANVFGWVDFTGNNAAKVEQVKPGKASTYSHSLDPFDPSNMR